MPTLQPIANALPAILNGAVVHPGHDWRHMTKRERGEWFEANGAEVREATAAFRLAAVKYAAVLVRTGAAERRGMSVSDFADVIDDDLSRVLAEEVRDWLGLGSQG